MNSKLDYQLLERKGENEMFTVFEETWKEGEQAGRAEGRAEEIIAAGYEFGLSEKTILERLQKKLLITPQASPEYLCNLHKRDRATLLNYKCFASFIRRTTIKPLIFQKLVLFITLYVTP